MGLCSAIYALLRYGIIVVEADKTAKRVCMHSMKENNLLNSRLKK